ncbi:MULTISPECIES: PLP-dependent aminotransferase family protein [unclassified Janthinobacterium]|uniref:MocR-like pyridoxine biosynthesis transcription factor PdxR n=1 Tax=unclassified Janthinobacterium TaxID=2610881 RepID=UPI00160B4DDE|nr:MULTISPECIES: PLP-dependent aminotransferase family protein [unclassified Janthinobacterium]MBB5369796.1 GntR family transcriptional regulator/MocR family aminotransferase [Janthinobacterium sp. K2C7]MBB5382602.1 GntR family transcriptional regulator/MocR family aminotransferase [Janthinobacterium sp. K2Li3]MBB5384587.1 GntR family transcriptional regulator/MocR family aminotransferase [Janthinobacterium sp. K2E3]
MHPQTFLELPLSRAADAAPLQRQLHARLKTAILGGELPAGSSLPGSRALAATLGIARNTVSAVYDQLAVEGYVLARRQGTQVAAQSHREERPAQSAAPVLARRVAQFTAPLAMHRPAALRPGEPALPQFPLAAWRRALDVAYQGNTAALGYGDPAGEPALRAAIARYLAVARGVRCSAEQIVITEGAQEALTLCVRLLTNPGDIVWVEDPGYRGIKAAMQAGDLRILPMRVDGHGLTATPEDWREYPPRLVYTTPAHQYPLGAVLPVPRRLQLIAAARAHGAWLIEDDYDSEFRHAGEPVAAMQGLPGDGPVLYVGTFSKTMFPALRLGFLVLPPALLAVAQAPLAAMLRGGHRHEQLAMAHFIDSGQYARHLGRMRRLYRARQQSLRAALVHHFDVPHTVEGGHCGMHLTVRLPPAFPDSVIAAAAQAYGMAVSPLSGFSLAPKDEDNGLVIGYGNTAPELYGSLLGRLAMLARQASTA